MTSGSAEIAVDDAGVSLSGDIDAALTYDLLINDQHVWSLSPGQDMAARAGARWAAWPRVLAPHLHGFGAVVVREHVSGVTVAATEHDFAGLHDERVAVVDGQGNPLLVDKWGPLMRPLAGESEDDREFLMDALERLLASLNDGCGVPGFVCFGTLLGAVRDRELIGHDNDVDLAYLSRFTHPVDITREAYRVERRLRADGWTIRRGSAVRINVHVKMPNGRMRFVDVFTFGWVDGVLYMPSDVAVPARPETMLPLGTVELAGRRVPAPADPETLLELVYGPGWRVPDPAFRYETPAALRRRFDGWYGGLHYGRKNWDRFAARSSERLPEGPSDFARWVAERYPDHRLLVDIGTGNGRDALWLAGHGRPVLGLDFVLSWLNGATRAAKRAELPAVFRPFNLSDTREVLSLGAALARDEEAPDLYARLLLSSLRDDTRENLWRLASMSLRRGGRLFLEFRTALDAGRPHAFGAAKGRRRFLAVDQVVAEIEAMGGRCVESEVGHGLAVFESEDPHICRLVAAWT